MADESHRELTFRRLTVAQLRSCDEDSGVEAMFLESARFFRLPEDPGQAAGILAALKRSLAEGTPVEVGLRGPDGDLILAVRDGGEAL